MRYRKHCPLCGCRGTVTTIESPQPDDRGGIEYVKYQRCTYCGATSEEMDKA